MNLVYFNSKPSNPTQINISVPNLLFPPFSFYRKFISIAEIQSLFSPETYFYNEGIIGRWIISPKVFDIDIDHKPKIKPNNADDLRKCMNYYFIRTTDLLHKANKKKKDSGFFSAEKMLLVTIMSFNR